MIEKADKLKKINERKEKELKSIINYNDDDDVDEIEGHITKNKEEENCIQGRSNCKKIT